MVKKGLLVFTHTPPYPPVTGGKVRYYNLLKGLAQSFDLYLLSLAQREERALGLGELGGLLKKAVMIPFEKPRPSRGGKLKNLLCLHPWDMNFEVSEARLAFQELLKSHPISAVLIWTQMLSSYVQYVPWGIKKVLDIDDIQFIRVQRATRELPWGKKRLGYMLEVPKIRLFEKRMLKSFDLAFVCSELDRIRVLGLGTKTPIEIVPNGVDVGYFNPAGFEEWAHPSLLYFGGLGSQGGDGVLRFIEEIYPGIRKRLPQVRFHIVGKDPLPEIIKSAGSESSIILEGEAKDVRPYIAGAWVTVVPLWAGSGTRLKILEASAMARPAVTTPVGAEGLELKAGEEIFVEESPEGFAQRCFELLSSLKLRKEVGLKARKAVVGRYNWEGITSHMARLISELMG